MRILIHTNYYNINLKELHENTEVYLKSLEKNYKDLCQGKYLRCPKWKPCQVKIM